MKHDRLSHIVLSLTAGGLLLLGLFCLLNEKPLLVRAAPGDLFVRPFGSGDCSQGNPCDLDSALSQAIEGDTLYVAQGVYTSSGDAVVTVTRSITLYGGWDGTATTPVVRDPEMNPTILDGEDARRVVTIAGDISPTLDGFIITRGQANHASYLAGHGGGIFSEEASPIIRDNTIISNTASIAPTGGKGGGIYLDGASASARISGNRVLSNTVHGEGWSDGGGGLYLSDSDVTVQSNLIQGNTTDQAGGGIYIACCGTFRILDNEIRSNTSALNGGGIYSRFSSLPHIQGNLIVDNSAAWYGGGAMFTNGPQPTFVANRVFSNTADSGAGVLVTGSGHYTLTNNVVARNDNGGISIWKGTRNDLVAHNTVVLNGGLQGGIVLDGGFITPTVVSNIVVSNTYGIRAHFSASGTLDYNDVWGNEVQDYDLPGTLESGVHDIQADPLFVDQAEDDFHLRAGSPCIDAGTDAGVRADLDGDSRPIGDGYDIGADEARLHVYLPLVNKGSPSDGAAAR